MLQIFSSPSKYIQGCGELQNLLTYAKSYGSRFMVILSERRKKTLKPVFDTMEKDSGCGFKYGIFQGETTYTEIDRLKQLYDSLDCDCVIGVGGGKCLDTAKMVSKYANCPLIIIPTIAATDAPSSSYAVIYTEEGQFLRTCYLKNPPELVLVDLDIIVHAPVRFFVSGMGDALATYYEARTCIEGYRTHDVGVPDSRDLKNETVVKAVSTKTSAALAKTCAEILLNEGIIAKQAVEKQVVTKAVENVTEANCLLSSIGFESNGVASAHAIYSGFTYLEGSEKTLHGEYVAFGTIAMLIYENRSIEEIRKIIEFCISVGLPVTFSDLRWPDISRDELETVAKVAASPEQTAVNEPFEVTWQGILGALITADSLGGSMK